MISIIIPAYNEEGRIGNSIEKISKYFVNEDYEIIVIDDGSSDRTREVVSKFENVKLNEKRKNRGKGYSVKEGIFMSKGEIILVSDADLSTPIEEFAKLNKYLGKYDIIIGSRALKDSKVQNNIFRKLLGRFGNFLIRFFLYHFN